MTQDAGACTHSVSSEPGDRCTLPTNLAALATGVTEATIRKWVSRGKLTRYGSAGRAEYDVEELMRLAGSSLLTARASDG